MEITPKPIDFSKKTVWHWHIRRIVIGCILAFLYIYAFTALTLIIFDPAAFEMTSNSKDKTNSAALIKLITQNPTFITAMFAYLGSMFNITRFFVLTSGSQSDMSIAWYITRPFQAVLAGIFLYYVFYAGQLIFFNMSPTEGEGSVNIYTISILAVLAGMFTEQVYESLQALSKKLIVVEKPAEGKG